VTQPFTFSSLDRPCHAALAVPAGDDPAGAVVIVHEWYGLNDQIRGVADRFAAEGFLALAVDLYDGRVAADDADAMRLSGELKTADAVRIIGDAVAALRALPRANGKVGVTGFCLGGAMALAAGCGVPGLSAVVPFYGIAKAEFLDWSRLRAPVLAHFGNTDPIIDPERPRALAESAQAAGVRFELHMYDAGHAFMREGDDQHYDAPSAALAWARTLELLRANLG